MRVKIYTDGACSGNPGIGGWGAVLKTLDYEKKISGSEKNTTNNRMELMAAIQALKSLKFTCNVDLYTDSVYLQNGVKLWLKNWKKNNWKTANKKSVKNQDLWMQLDKIQSKHKIEWYWIKGHAGHHENEQADALAREEIKAAKYSTKSP